MKTFFTLLLLTLSLNIFADSQVFIEKLESETVLVPACDLCDGGTLVTKVDINISYYRCSALPESAFEVEINKERVGFSSEVKTLTIKTVGGPYVDCFGPSQKISTTITVDDLDGSEKFYITNPSLISAR